jgi:hypothetical protein
MSATPNFSAWQISSEALRQELLILSLIKDVRTTIPVKVMAVHPGTGSPPSIGTVDIQPLVQTVDGTGKLWNLGVTHNAQFSRIQSGGTAIVVDPSVGDIGLASACDRDISSVIAAAGLAGPGSARTHDLADLVYLFSIISAAEITQYILANSSGITLLSPNTIKVQGQQINLNGVTIDSSGNLTSPATIKAATDVIGGATDISLVNHTHTSASPGSPTSPPIP